MGERAGSRGTGWASKANQVLSALGGGKVWVKKYLWNGEMGRFMSVSCGSPLSPERDTSDTFKASPAIFQPGSLNHEPAFQGK